MHEWGGKSRGIRAALEAGGHTITDVLTGADVFLIDHMSVNDGHRRYIDYCNRQRIPVVHYPHGGGVAVEYDGIVPTDADIAFHMVHAPGHVEVMERFGYPHRLEVIGWDYTPIVPHTPTAGNRILFAPQHPWGDGRTLEKERVEENRRAYEKFYKLDCEKAVRFIGAPAPNGITKAEGVRLITGVLDNSYTDILAADVVIGHGTFAFMAVALGKPTVMIERAVGVSPGCQVPAHWDSYEARLRFPFNTDDGPLDEVVEAARCGGPELDEWKAAFIGEPMDPVHVRGLVESVARVPV